MTDLPWCAIVPFVDDPVDLLACMMVSKAARKAAGRELNSSSTTNAANQPPTVAHKMMFEGFLKKPEEFPGFKDMDRRCAQYSGPFRPNKIHQMSDILAKNVIVLKYEKTYQKEDSAVAIVDDEGLLIAIYKFQSDRDYGEHCRCILRGGKQLCNLPCVTLTNSGALRPGVRSADNTWLFETPTLNWVCNANCNANEEDQFELFDVAMPNYKLFRLFQGRLSPTEVATVLMHALSSDPTLIFAYAKAVHLHFGYLMSGAVDGQISMQYILIGESDDYNYGGYVSRGEALRQWGSELKRIDYGTKYKNSKKRARSKIT